MFCQRCCKNEAVGFFDDDGLWTTDQDLEACVELGMWPVCQGCADLEMAMADERMKEAQE